MIFGDSDKQSKNPNDLINFDSVDFNSDLNTNLNIEEKLFGKLNHEELYTMFEKAGIIRKLKERGYEDCEFITEFISNLDNRIFIKSKEQEILIHIRLKFSDFFIKAINENRKMIYIDWLLTQNVKLGTTLHKKKLFPGQEYPGLNIFGEFTNFIFLLYSELNCYGVFNIPEYFHDAVLFQKNFKFVSPEKQGYFLCLLDTFKNIPIRKISNLIQENKIYFKEKDEVFIWLHGEMLSTENEQLKESIFDKDYFERVKKFQKTLLYIKEV
jgi:hypothetical protein